MSFVLSVYSLPELETLKQYRLISLFTNAKQMFGLGETCNKRDCSGPGGGATTDGQHSGSTKSDAGGNGDGNDGGCTVTEHGWHAGGLLSCFVCG